MTFDEDAMDRAMKSLDSTKSFCSSHQKRGFSLFSSSSASNDKLSPHERVHRRCIVADCLLFEAVLVFLKQGFTSYVKGGYLLRKAWKTYEKVYQEMEQCCSCPSPISKHGSLSANKHVGTSMYDRKAATVEPVVDEADEKIEEVAVSPQEIDEAMNGMDIAFASLGMGGGSESQESTNGASGESQSSSQSSNGEHRDFLQPVGLTQVCC